MKLKMKLAIELILIVILLTVLVVPVAAQAGSVPKAMPLPPIAAQSGAPEQAISLTDLFTQWGALAGVGALIALIINILKTLNVVQDGQAVTWSTGLNLVGMAGLLLLKVYRPDMDIGTMDSTAGQIAQAGLIIFGLLVQMLSSKGTHYAVTGVPLIGKSFTAEREKASTVGQE